MYIQYLRSLCADCYVFFFFFKFIFTSPISFFFLLSCNFLVTLYQFVMNFWNVRTHTIDYMKRNIGNFFIKKITKFLFLLVWLAPFARSLIWLFIVIRFIFKISLMPEAEAAMYTHDAYNENFLPASKQIIIYHHINREREREKREEKNNNSSRKTKTNFIVMYICFTLFYRTYSHATTHASTYACTNAHTHTVIFRPFAWLAPTNAMTSSLHL